MKSIANSFLLCFFVCFLFGVGKAQEQSNSSFKIPKEDKNYGSFAFVEGVYHYSRYLRNTDKLANILENRANSFAFKIGLQTVGKDDWERDWGYPSYGIGFYSASFGPADTLGEPSALYAFYSGPIRRWNRLGLFYEMGVGVSYDFVKYDPITNPEQDLIGSSVNVYLEARFFLMYRLSDRLDASLGLDLIHFSNGNTRTPNTGLNIYGPNIGLRYNFNPIKNYTKKIDPDYQPPLRPTFIDKETPKVDRANYLHLFMAGAGKTTRKQIFDGPTYFAGTINLDFSHQYSNVARWNTGVDYFFDSSLRERVEESEDATLSDLSQVGVHIGHEFLVPRISFITQLGVYAYNQANKGPWYMRFNLRIKVIENLAIQGGLKTINGGAADFIEWGLSYQLMKK